MSNLQSLNITSGETLIVEKLSVERNCDTTHLIPDKPLMYCKGQSCSLDSEVLSPNLSGATCHSLQRRYASLIYRHYV